MKKIPVLVVLLTAHAMTSAAQSVVTTLPQKNRIEVTGQAEIEVAPDELYFSVSLKEYFEDEKNQKNKVVITTLEKQLLDAVGKAGLPKENLTVTAIGGSQFSWEKKKKPATFLESKQYELKVSTPEKLDGILSQLDSRGIAYAHISRVEHSRKEALKKEVKIMALKAAKEKATYLLEAVDERLGAVMEIRELEDYQTYPQLYARTANMAKMEAAADVVTDSPVEFRKIKFSYRMQTVFEIKEN